METPHEPEAPTTRLSGRIKRHRPAYDAEPSSRTGHLLAAIAKHGAQFGLPSAVPSEVAACAFDEAPRALPFSRHHPTRRADDNGPDFMQDWVQCDRCDKWRQLPEGVVVPCGLAWECALNPDANRNKCDLTEDEFEEAGFDDESVADSASELRGIAAGVSRGRWERGLSARL